MYRRERHSHNPPLEHNNRLHRKLFQIPHINNPILPTRRQQTIPDTNRRTCQLLMRLPDIPDDLELTLGVPLVDHDPSVKGTYDQQAVLL